LEIKRPMSSPLPMDAHLPAVLRALEEHASVVVTAEPGAGKTTRVPPALLKAPFAQGKEIWVLQPRRLAAKTAALRVAEEMGESVGRTVGYQFRFEKCGGSETRLKFLTDGMLPPLAQGDPTLRQIACVVLDEFHERSLALDLALGYLRRLQVTTRPDLKLVVMSATLDIQALSTCLSDCPAIKSEGRLFPIRTEWRPLPGEVDLSSKVKAVVREWSRPGVPGTALVFLPGVPEIRRCARELEGLSLKVECLYGDLSVEEQQRVLNPEEGQRVILSTNVAETSLTVPGVTAVLDSGLTRQARVSAWSGMERLVTVSSSRASATQRAGRAGRVQEGVCYRLYSQFEFEHRSPYDIPEILRADLSKALLDLACLGVENAENFPWFQAPPLDALRAATELLRRMGAVDAQGRLTETGRKMSRFSIPPRLARFLLGVQELAPNDNGTLRRACRLAALLSEEKAESQDLLEELSKYQPDYQAKRLEEQLADRLGLPKDATFQRGAKADAVILAKAMLMAFPDRVSKARPADHKAARGREAQFRELVLCNGGSATASDGALLREHEYFVVVEAIETAGVSGAGAVRGAGGTGVARTQAKARSICPIEADWLLDFFTDDLVEETTREWNKASGRVEGFRRLQYGQLVLDEKALDAGSLGDEGEDLLFKGALSAGRQAYCDPDELDNFLHRAKFVQEHVKDFPSFDDQMVEKTLRELCRGRRNLADLKEAALTATLEAKLSPKDRSTLEKLAPAYVALKGGRRAKVTYESGKPPWIESRIQDFYGMKETPKVGGGEVPVVMHLLSPAKRPVQVTSDLAGFWKNHYPQIRRELGRRYPKQKWPEDPLS
jgi:ATP-dependent helicase HrpB